MIAPRTIEQYTLTYTAENGEERVVHTTNDRAKADKWWGGMVLMDNRCTLYRKGTVIKVHEKSAIA